MYLKYQLMTYIFYLCMIGLNIFIINALISWYLDKRRTKDG